MLFPIYLLDHVNYVYELLHFNAHLQSPRVTYEFAQAKED